ncbi:MAG: SDR family NAD(P)-dependent oxidoreductase [Pseudomonadota bacterium]
MSHVRAMITGASAGLGADFARQLADRCDSLVLVARREERLAELRSEIDDRCDVQILVADLGTEEGRGRAVETMRQGAAPAYLINNAGFSTLGRYAKSNLDRELDMVRLHQDATLALTRAALPAMLDAGAGAIVNVASIGGFLRMPGNAVYAATKAFLVSFTHSLTAELENSGLRIQCLCPGYTRTELHSRDDFAAFDVSRVPDEMWMDSTEVVRESLEALQNPEGSWLVVNGDHNRVLAKESAHDLAAMI